jgi:hypothetical protein
VYSFGFSLIGAAAKFYPYVLRALLEMEQHTLGHPLKELNGKRGHVGLYRVEAVHPFTQQRTCLWQQGTMYSEKLPAGITVDDIRIRAKQLPHHAISINFLSPTRLVAGEHVVRKPDFTVLILRLAERIEQIRQAYGQLDEREQAGGRAWYLALKTQAERIELLKDETRWVDVQSYSHRQHQQIAIGGLLGKASFIGPLTDFHELLIWGELLRVGKNIVKGAGYYRIEA